MPDVATHSAAVDDLFAKLSDFSEIKAAKIRFDELYDQRKQEELQKIKHAAEQIDHTLVANGHDKPKRRGRKPKDHDA